MNGRIRKVDIMHVSLRLKRPFKHAITARQESQSIFVKVTLSDGTTGYGESLPREYVTGETIDSVRDTLRSVIKRFVLGHYPRSYTETPALIKGLGIKQGAANCALELALLDAYGKYFELPITSIIGRRFNNSIQYSGVIGAESILSVINKSLLFKAFGIQFVKMKVGIGDDIARLSTARSILGRNVNIRVDANCAWDSDEAIRMIEKMRRFNISAVEQPVKADDYKGLKAVSDAVEEPIIADESICSIEDVEKLVRLKACDGFNIRISKCGGILNSLSIAKIARDNRISFQLGCQVGESGVLSAAGWHFASVLRDVTFCEGSYGRHLLREDVTEEDMTITRGGMVKAISGPGLGINVVDEALDRYTISKESLTT